MAGAYRYPVIEIPGDESGDKYRRAMPDTRLINKLAEDLAYIYIGRNGHKHRYFAWGDILEIGRRVAQYKAAHKLTPSEIKYNEDKMQRQLESMTNMAADIDPEILWDIVQDFAMDPLMRE